MPLSSNIIHGPEEAVEVPRGSMGLHLFNVLKKQNPNNIINLDASTKKTLTYGRALEDSIKCSSILNRLGVRKDDIIAIFSENSINYCLPVLGALYMGVTVNTINPTYTADELKHALCISKAKVVFCSEKVLSTVLQVKRELQFLETVVVMGLSTSNESYLSYERLIKSTELDTSYTPEELEPEHNAFICLSSGTTGLSKGVLLSHDNLRSPISYFGDSRFINAQPEDVTVLFLPLFHIYGLLIQMTAFTNGMKVIMMDKFVPDLFLKSIEEYQATKLFVVPPILLFMVKYSGKNRYDLSSIRDIIAGAAPLSKEIQDQAERCLGMITVRQLYGLTETTGPVTVQRTDEKKTGTVGSLVPGTSAKVWDPITKKVLGPMEVGELCFKNSVIMTGYFGNDIATMGSIDVEGFFHSGDLGYYDEDGLFYAVDRIKEVIKYKGFQVPPAELEALIVTHPEVKECGVIGIPDERAGEVPLAYVVPLSGSKITEDEIINFVAERISINKRLYGGVRFTEEIPKNPSGKILRRNLRELFKSS